MTYDPRGADPQDPLPEGRWLWRRLYVFSLSLGLWLLLLTALGRAPAAAVAPLAFGLMWLLGFVLVLYLVAPSAQQTAHLVLGFRRGAGR